MTIADALAAIHRLINSHEEILENDREYLARPPGGFSDPEVTEAREAVVLIRRRLMALGEQDA